MHLCRCSRRHVGVVEQSRHFENKFSASKTNRPTDESGRSTFGGRRRGSHTYTFEWESHYKVFLSLQPRLSRLDPAWIYEQSKPLLPYLLPPSATRRVRKSVLDDPSSNMAGAWGLPSRLN
ncbi:hypothetical protein HI914_04772 [Erysiphe necator]|nr:hypothetical protein HI914_04772 [Erysiphe necator]